MVNVSYFTINAQPLCFNENWYITLHRALGCESVYLPLLKWQIHSFISKGTTYVHVDDILLIGFHHAVIKLSTFEMDRAIFQGRDHRRKTHYYGYWYEQAAHFYALISYPCCQGVTPSYICRHQRRDCFLAAATAVIRGNVGRVWSRRN